MVLRRHVRALWFSLSLFLMVMQGRAQVAVGDVYSSDATEKGPVELSPPRTREMSRSTVKE